MQQLSQTYRGRLREAKRVLKEAKFIIIGGGAGLSDAAGLCYSGIRFTENFLPFINKYGIKDMYTAGFYPFPTEKERWCYWAKHIKVNRYDPPAAALYRDLRRLAEGKPYFVITTNVDHQFYKAGFPEERIFAVQGDYGLNQCAKGCHHRRYPNEEAVERMVEATVDCAVPGELLPRCPVCGGPMEPNLRKDGYFVEDEAWRAAQERFNGFLREAMNQPLALLELGVGYNTPGIIRFPFEQVVHEAKNAVLIRLNRDYPQGPDQNKEKTIAFCEDMAMVVRELLEGEENT